MRSIARLSLGTLIALAGIAACSSGQTVNPSQSQLSDFQWAVMNNNALLLVEDGDLLYPAVRQGTAVYESNPEQIDVRLYRDSESRRVSILRVSSPRRLDDDTHVAEVRRDSRWEQAGAFRLRGAQFEIRTPAGSWERIEYAAVRFRPR